MNVLFNWRMYFDPVACNVIVELLEEQAIIEI
jgi:hypothetical protein